MLTSTQILLRFFLIGQTAQKGFYSMIIKVLEDQDDDDDDNDEDDDDDNGSPGDNGKTKKMKSLIVS